MKLTPIRFLLIFLVPMIAVPMVIAQEDGFEALFEADLSNALFPEGIWTVDENGILTASADEIIWSELEYEDVILKLEFKTEHETNSGVFVYGSNRVEWIPNSIEIQIADDHSARWGNSRRDFQCGAFFGRQAAYQSNVKQPGEWNEMTVYCHGAVIVVYLNGMCVNLFDLRKFTNGFTNPDGSEVPSWLRKPPSTLPTKGHIGFQGKHAGAPIYFRNIRVKKLP